MPRVGLRFGKVLNSDSILLYPATSASYIDLNFLCGICPDLITKTRSMHSQPKYAPIQF